MNTPKRNSRQRGSVTLIALGLGAVLLIGIAAMYQFSSHRMQTTTLEGKKQAALAIAEAGLNLALAELRNDAAFATHKLGPGFTWTNTNVKRNVSVPDATPFNLKLARTPDNGIYKGTLGPGEFKVRCAPMSDYPEDPSSVNVNTKNQFVKVTAMGRFDDMVRVIDAIIQRRYLGREFLMYDGDILSIVFGLTTGGGVNRFATGHLYGYKGIEIGMVAQSNHTGWSTSGTKQELVDVEMMSSGIGGIWFYSDTPVGFRSRKADNLLAFNCIMKANVTRQDITDKIVNGTYEPPDRKDKGGVPKELLSFRPDLNPDDASKKDAVASYVLFGDKGIKLEPVEPPFETYKKQAQACSGYYIGAGNTNWPVIADGSTQFKMGSVRVIDFGTDIRKDVDPNEKPPDMSQTGNTIFAECPLVIRGNPPKGLMIVSNEDVYISGDFNQAGDQTGTLPKAANRYGLPQNWKGGDPKAADDYADNIRQRLEKDYSLNPNQRVHQPIHVVARKRVIYDYRDPRYVFENELYPYLKYRLGKAVAAGSDDMAKKLKAVPAFVTVPAGAAPGLAAADTVASETAVRDGVKNLLETQLKMANSATQPLLDEFAKAWNDNSKSFPDQVMEDLTKKVWQKMSAEFNNGGNGADKDWAVNKLVYDLRAETRPPNSYLWYPEMTTNGMFESCAHRNTSYCLGPDESKHFDEIGNHALTTSGGPHAWAVHSPSPSDFIHRMYGSEIRMSLPATKTSYTVGALSTQYTPPLRRKIYDTKLPLFPDLPNEHALFVILTWKEDRGDLSAFNSL